MYYCYRRAVKERIGEVAEIHRLLWTTNFKKFFVSVMNMLLMYLLVSIKVENGHKKYLALVLKLCYHYGILLNRLKYYTERWII
jgi:hypothetical protein